MMKKKSNCASEVSTMDSGGLQDCQCFICNSKECLLQHQYSLDSNQWDCDNNGNQDQESYTASNSKQTPSIDEIKHFISVDYDLPPKKKLKTPLDEPIYTECEVQPEDFNQQGSQFDALSHLSKSLSEEFNSFRRGQNPLRYSQDSESYQTYSELSDNNPYFECSSSHFSYPNSQKQDPDPYLNRSAKKLVGKLDMKKSDSKNIPKTFGNYLKTYLQDLSKRQQLSECAKKFMNVEGQHNYTLKQFKTLFQCEQSKPYLQDFFEFKLYACLIQSKRKQNPQGVIPYIEQYILGIRYPDKFISNVTSVKGQTRKKKARTK